MRSSINIKYDYNDNSIIENYLATNSHAQIIKGVFEGIIYGGHNAHIAYGPYGSGKSYISSIIAGVLSKSYTKNQIKNLCNKYEDIDSSISKLIELVSTKKQKYITVIMNGYEGNFDVAFTMKLSEALRNQKLLKYIPSYFNGVKEAIFRWKKEYPNTYNQFLSMLNEINSDVESFLSKIENNDNDWINWFQKAYKNLSSGQEFNLKFINNTLSVIEECTPILKKHGYGLLLIYDEFGRYLQNLKTDEVNGFMQKLQDIAEYANKEEHSFGCLFITHKQISEYFTFLEPKQRGEFSKVEQRFLSYEIKSDYSTFLLISSKFLGENRNFILPEIDDFIQKFTLKIALFSSYYSDSYIINDIIYKMYPLHPLTVYMLPKISSAFGQNERTLFTFLNDRGEYGLSQYIEKDLGYFYPDMLVDYFFESFDENNSELIKNSIVYSNKIKKIRLQISKEYLYLSERIFKFIFLWGVTFNSEHIRLDSPFLSYALGIDKEEIDFALKELVSNKFIRYNQIELQYEIFQGSSLDIDNEIAKRKSDKEKNRSLLLDILNELNPYKYIYPKKYNSINDIIRYVRLFFTTNDYNSLDFEFADLYLPVYIGNQSSDLLVYGIAKFSFNDIEDELVKYSILEDILSDRFYVINYSNLVSEIEYELSVIKHNLSKFFDRVFVDTEINFYTDKKYFHSISEMENYFSSYFDDTFNKYIEITNDQINMFEISSVQKNAFKDVVDRVLNDYENIEVLAEGTQPSNLIYFSVLKRNMNNQFYFGLKHIIDDYINENVKGRFVDLINILIAPPFGFRPYVAILMLSMIIKDKWKDIILFKNDSFIPNFSIDILLVDLYYEFKLEFIVPKSMKLFSKNDSYNYITYSYNVFDNTNRDYLEKIEDVYKDYLTLNDNKSLSIRVCSSMYNWYISLPVITQQGINLSMSDIEFLKIIKNMRINPIDSILQLYNNFDDADFVRNTKISIEYSFEDFLNTFENQLLLELGIRDINSWINNLDGIEKKTNRIAIALLNKKTLVETYADQIENIDIKKWTKSSFDSLKRKIKEDYVKINLDKVKFDSLIINGKSLAIQDIDLSQKGIVTYSNIVNLIEATSKYLTQSEIEKITLMLLERYVK